MQTNIAVAAMARSGIREIMDLAYAKPTAIRLEIGDPEFPTPPHVIAAADRAARAGGTHYTPNVGIPELRGEIAAKVQRINGYTTQPDQIIVTQGATQGIYTALLALTNQGDEVLLPNPAWPNYVMMTHALGLRPVGYPLPAESGYLPVVAQLSGLLTQNTRILLINSPSNPVGAVIDSGRMRELLDFAARHDLWVVADECYDQIVYDDTFISAAALDSQRVISTYSFSKTYAMTGWRIGYLVVPTPLAETVAKCQEPLIACVNTPTQYAALAALTGPQTYVDDMRNAYHRRARLADGILSSAGVPTFQPAGAFCAWVDVTATGLNDREFALRLLSEHDVAVAPGTAFGSAGAGYVRISLAGADADIAEGTNRLVRFHATLA